VSGHRRASCLLLLGLFWISVAGTPRPTVVLDTLQLAEADDDVDAQQRVEKQVPDQHFPGAQDLTAKAPRRAVSVFWTRTRDRRSAPGPLRDLLQRAPAIPGFASRLDLCPAFTKPGSLLLHSPGTPQNHRSPPV